MNTISTSVQPVAQTSAPSPAPVPPPGVATLPLVTKRPNFQLWVTLTGTLAANAIGGLGLTPTQYKPVPIIYERYIPMPRLWHNKPLDRWEPEQYGSSIFDPAWSLDQIKQWARRFAVTHLAPVEKGGGGGGPVIIDIEDVHPFHATMHNAVPNLERMRLDLATHHGVTDPFDQNDMIRFGLRQVWETLMDSLAANGVDASFYGHTPVRVAATPEALRDGRCWFDKRQRRTHPVIYEWEANRGFVDFANQVIRQRIRAAKRLSPLAPCYPFITDLLDDGSGNAGPRVSAEHFESMIQVSRDEGADGVVFWRHIGNTADLKAWLGAADRIVKPALANHFAVATPAAEVVTA